MNRTNSGPEEIERLRWARTSGMLVGIGLTGMVWLFVTGHLLVGFVLAVVVHGFVFWDIQRRPD